MAEVLGKDPDTYDRERREFLRSLRDFHHSRGTPIPRSPRISGKEIDLYLLFSLVTSRGGYERVNHSNDWANFLPHFLGWRECANGAVALKHLYLRYLDHYEKVQIRGVEVDDGEDVGDDSGLGLAGSRRLRRGGGGHTVHAVPLSYNHAQHVLSESTRQQLEMAPLTSGPSEYEKILLSLSSCLPNEQEFAINILTLLVSEGSKDPLRLEKCPALVDYLCFHAGVFRDESLKKLHESYVEKHELPDMTSYWTEAIPNADVRDALLHCPPVVHEVQTGKKRPAAPSSPAGAVSDAKKPAVTDGDDVLDVAAAADGGEDVMETDDVEAEGVVPDGGGNSLKDCDSDGGGADGDEDEDEDDDEESSDCLSDRRVWGGDGRTSPDPLSSGGALFARERGLGATDKRGTKASRIALILHNASFEDHNLRVLADSPTLLRFLLMCINAASGGGSGVQLSHTAWSTLANLGPEVRLRDPEADRISAQLLKTLVTTLLTSPDRAQIMGALEALGRLACREGNEENLAAYLPEAAYRRICDLLTIEDILLLLVTLETLLCLTGIGGKVCNAIAEHACGAVDALVSMLTIEAQSYGSRACILMRVIETTTTTAVPNASGAANAAGVEGNSALGAGATCKDDDDSQQSRLAAGGEESARRPGGAPVPSLVMKAKPSSGSPAGSPAPAAAAAAAQQNGQPTVLAYTPVRTYGGETARILIPKSAIRQQVVATTNGPSSVPGSPRPAGSVVLQRQQVAAAMAGATGAQPQQVNPGQQQQPVAQFRAPQPQIVRPGAPGAVLRPAGVVVLNTGQTVGIQSQQRLTVGKNYDAATGKVETSATPNPSDSDNEAYAVQWIKTNYQAEQGSTIEQSELYKDYMVCMSSNKRDRLPPATFAYCVRMVFGSQVGPFQKKLPGGAINHYHYFGISKRPVPLPSANVAAPTSAAATTTTQVVNPGGVVPVTNGGVGVGVVRNNAAAAAAQQQQSHPVRPQLVAGAGTGAAGQPQTHVVRQQVVSLRHAAPAAPSTVAGGTPVLVSAPSSMTITQSAVPTASAPAQNGNVGRVQSGNSSILKAQLSTPPRGPAPTNGAKQMETPDSTTTTTTQTAGGGPAPGLIHRGLAASSSSLPQPQQVVKPASAASVPTAYVVQPQQQQQHHHGGAQHGHGQQQVLLATAGSGGGANGRSYVIVPTSSTASVVHQAQPSVSVRNVNSSLGVPAVPSTFIPQQVVIRTAAAPVTSLSNAIISGSQEMRPLYNNVVVTVSSSSSSVVNSNVVYTASTSVNSVNNFQQATVVPSSANQYHLVTAARQPSLAAAVQSQNQNQHQHGNKGLLAEMLEREVHNKEMPAANGAVEKEIRISDKGLELVPRPGGLGAASGTTSSTTSDAVMTNGDDCSSSGLMKRKMNEPVGIGEPAAKRVAVGDVQEDGRIRCLDGVDRGSDFEFTDDDEDDDDEACGDDPRNEQQHVDRGRRIRVDGDDEDLRIVCLDGVNERDGSVQVPTSSASVAVADVSYLPPGATSVVVLNQGQGFIPHSHGAHQSQPTPRYVTVTQQATSSSSSSQSPQVQMQLQRNKIELPHVCLNPETCGEPGCTEKFLDSLEEQAGGGRSGAVVSTSTAVAAASPGAVQMASIHQQVVQRPSGASVQQQQQPQQMVVVRQPGGQQFQYVTIRNGQPGQQTMILQQQPAMMQSVPQQQQQQQLQQQQQRVTMQQQQMQQHQVSQQQQQHVVLTTAPGPNQTVGGGPGQATFLVPHHAGPGQQGGLKILLVPQQHGAAQKVAIVGQAAQQLLQQHTQQQQHHQHQQVVHHAASGTMQGHHHHHHHQQQTTVVVSGSQVVHHPQLVQTSAHLGTVQSGTVTFAQQGQQVVSVAGHHPGVATMTRVSAPAGVRAVAVPTRPGLQQSPVVVGGCGPTASVVAPGQVRFVTAQGPRVITPTVAAAAPVVQTVSPNSPMGGPTAAGGNGSGSGSGSSSSGPASPCMRSTGSQTNTNQPPKILTPRTPSAAARATVAAVVRTVASGHAVTQPSSLATATVVASQQQQQQGFQSQPPPLTARTAAVNSGTGAVASRQPQSSAAAVVAVGANQQQHPTSGVVRSTPGAAVQQHQQQLQATAVIRQVQVQHQHQPSVTVVARPGAVPVATAAAAVSSQAAGAPVVASKSLPKDEYLCEWSGCFAAFKNPNEVYPHACAHHCGDPSSTDEMVCLWGKCDSMKRKRFSLMTHLLDRHCSEQSLKAALNRRKRAAMGMPVPPEPEHAPPSAHAGYAPNAAYQAIRRHALEAVQQACKQEDKEGPVTKSIRLTAALILKNMVTYSESAKRLVRAYEPQLANVAASNMESSRTVSQILFDLQASPKRASSQSAVA